DLYEQINIAAAIFTTQISEKQLQFEINIAPEVPQFLVGDESKLHQIFVNLLSNAFKYTSKGGVTFNISCIGRTKDDATKLRFEIIDTGIGIPEDKQHTLFQAFVQIPQANAKVYGGTGLGLAIVKQLVTMMGGTVALTSEYGHGSAFTFEINFPLSNKDAVMDAKQQKENGIMQTTRISLPHEKNKQALNQKILVVEDSKIYQRLEREMLESWGFKFELAENGQDACRIFSERGNEFNLILMDCQMPVMDGYQAAAEIRRLEQTQKAAKSIPIIALTAGSTNTNMDMELFSNAGMNDYIEKPLKKKQLEACLAKWL
ncbi:MAG: ATP-binding protein, partial [Victivallaceae bacterium]